MTITKALAKRCYSMSEPHLSGARLIIGFNTVAEASAAQMALPEQANDDHDWKWWFAIFPITLRNGPDRQRIWLRWYQYRFGGDFYEIRP